MHPREVIQKESCSTEIHRRSVQKRLEKDGFKNSSLEDYL